MLKTAVCNSLTPSSELRVDSQLLGLWSAGGNQWTPMIQEECFKMLDCPVQPSKKSQLPSNFSLFWAWIFLLMSVAAMLAPTSFSWGQDQYPTEIGTEKRLISIPK